MTPERDPFEFEDILESPIEAANVSQVPQRSPFRYPGGKTWLIPHVRYWLKRVGAEDHLLIEPFAGGGIVSLTAVMERLVKSCLMIELDRDVAAVWHSILSPEMQLSKRVAEFEPTREAVESLVTSPVADIGDRGFRTLVLNRMRRGGILADGASFAQVGKGRRVLAPRWYPETLEKRIKKIQEYKDRIRFEEADGVAYLNRHSQWIMEQQAVLFVDPPYAAGGKRAGMRLYRHWNIDYRNLFEILANIGVNFMLTYDFSDEIIRLIIKHKFHSVRVQMKTTHHRKVQELIITNSPLFGK